MILTHTLRRTFALNGPLPAACIAYLRADPQLPTPTERTDTIEIEPRDDGLFSLRCSWGSHLVGSTRALEKALEKAIYALAASDEASSPHLNASVMRLDGRRILLVAETGVDLGELTVALLVKGAAFEGMGLVFLRPGGFVAHPTKPRLKFRRLARGGLFPPEKASHMLDLCQEEEYCSINPRIAGNDWSLTEGSVAVILFVERNDGGRSAVTRLRLDHALARLMRSMRTVGRPDVQMFTRLRTLLDEACTFRVSMGNPIAAADIILAQQPHMLVDEAKALRQGPRV